MVLKPFEESVEDQTEEDLYKRLKSLERELEFLEIQEDYIKVRRVADHFGLQRIRNLINLVSGFLFFFSSFSSFSFPSFFDRRSRRT